MSGMRAAMALVVALTACAQVPAARDPVGIAARVADATGIATTVVVTDADADALRQRVSAALARPLTVETAVQVAVLNNRGLQAAFAAADEHAVVDAALRLVTETRRAYCAAVAAQHVASYLEQALASAEATAELTRRLAQAGGANRLDQARAAELYVEVANQVRAARVDALLARESLTRALGLWGADIAYTLPATLPSLPATLALLPDAEADALRRRADVQDAHAAIATGGAAAAHRLEDLSIRVRSEVRAAHAAQQSAYEIARAYRDEIVPLRRVIDEEVLFRYNGMLVDVFTVLTTVRTSVAANVGAIVALRDFHVADANFRAALVGGGTPALPGATFVPHAEDTAGGH